MDVKKVATSILALSGDKDNILKVTHCVTRLRLVLKNQDKFEKEEIEKIQGVKGVILMGDQYQIILGTGVVNEVYEAFVKLTGDINSSEQGEKKGKLYQRVLKGLADIFIPIIPVLVASGVISGLVGVCIYPGYFSDTQSLVQLYPAFSGIAECLNMFQSSIFLFLPVLLGYSATKCFGGNPYVGAAMALIMVNPSLVNPTAIGGDVPVWNFFGMSIQQIGYQQTVLPVLASSFIIAKTDNYLQAKLPRIFRIMSAGISLIITGLIVFLLVGPLLRSIGFYITDILVWLYTNLGVLGGMLFGLLYAPCVITGMHHAFIPVETQLISDIANTGGTFILPIAAMSNVALGGSSLAIWFMSKDTDMKTESGIAGITSILGVSEPALFGVNLRYRYAFAAALISASLGGGLMALFHIRARGMGAGGVMGYLLYDPKNLLIYTLGMLLSAGLAFILTIIFKKMSEKHA